MRVIIIHIKDQCRRDDVECWFYMTIEFIKGKLPWSEISKYERDKIAKKVIFSLMKIISPKYFNKIIINYKDFDFRCE